MPSPIVSTIATVRESVCALLRLAADPEGGGSHAVLTGTVWCVVEDRVFVTAHHVLNDGAPRNPADLFFLVRAPGNGPNLQTWPVTGFLLEDEERDLAVIEAPISAGLEVPSLTVRLSPPPDGTAVLTYGYPAPEITSVTVDPPGVLTSLRTALFTHAAAGILASQYRVPGGDSLLEFDVAWHHGESGGPILTIDDPPVVFSIMQDYRIIKGPDGLMAGPRQGLSLGSLEATLASVGARLVP